MSNNPNPFWSVWIYSSFVNYFKTKCMPLSIPLYIQGEIRDSKISEFIDFRMNGPNFNELSHDYWRIDCYIATLLTMTLNEENIYKPNQLGGQLLNMFERDLPMYRLGTEGPESDGSVLGCMRLDPSRNEKIRQRNYGQIQSATQVTQSSIEAHYHMELSFIEEYLTANN